MTDSTACIRLEASIPDYQYREWSAALAKYGAVRGDFTSWGDGLSGRVLGLRELEQPPDQPEGWVRVELLCEKAAQP